MTSCYHREIVGSNSIFLWSINFNSLIFFPFTVVLRVKGNRKQKWYLSQIFNLLFPSHRHIDIFQITDFMFLLSLLIAFPREMECKLTVKLMSIVKLYQYCCFGFELCNFFFQSCPYFDRNPSFGDLQFIYL